MEVKLSAIYKNFRVEVSGQSGADVAAEMKNVLESLNRSGLRSEASGQNIIEEKVPSKIGEAETPVTDELLEGLVRFDDGEPVMLTPLHSVLEQESVKRTQQVKAFVVLSYALSKNGVKEQTTNKISKLMKKSGINAANIKHATGELDRLMYISRVKGEKTFNLTTKGEAAAIEVLKKAKITS